MLFVQFAVQFIHFFLGSFEGSFPGGGDFVEPSTATVHPIESGAQHARSLQSMQERIECAGADAVAVMREFLHHGEPEDGLLRSVQQHVDADETVEELALLIYHKNKYTSANVSVALTDIEIRYNFG
jgi:hypothetical protein